MAGGLRGPSLVSSRPSPCTGSCSRNAKKKRQSGSGGQLPGAAPGLNPSVGGSGIGHTQPHPKNAPVLERGSHLSRFTQLRTGS